MQAMRVYRLGDNHMSGRLYIDGKRVSRKQWDTSHLGRRLDTFQTRIKTRKDGSEMVREYHCLRSN
jgi:hypothetical protein